MTSTRRRTKNRRSNRRNLTTNNNGTEELCSKQRGIDVLDTKIEIPLNQSEKSEPDDEANSFNDSDKIFNTDKISTTAVNGTKWTTTERECEILKTFLVINRIRIPIFSSAWSLGRPISKNHRYHHPHLHQ